MTNSIRANLVDRGTAAQGLLKTLQHVGVDVDTLDDALTGTALTDALAELGVPVKLAGPIGEESHRRINEIVQQYSALKHNLSEVRGLMEAAVNNIDRAARA